MRASEDRTISEFSEWRELSVPRINYVNLHKIMFVSLVEVPFFFDLLRVSMTSFYLLRVKDGHPKNYVTYGLVEWCSLQIFMACKWLEQQITEVCNTIYVMFDNIKAVKRNWKIVTVIWTMTMLNTSQAHKITWLVTRCVINQTFRNFKCNFRPSLFHLSTPLTL